MFHFQAEFSKNDYAVSKCDMPDERTVMLIYTMSGVGAVLVVLYFVFLKIRSKKIFCAMKQT